MTETRIVAPTPAQVKSIKKLVSHIIGSQGSKGRIEDGRVIVEVRHDYCEAHYIDLHVAAWDCRSGEKLHTQGLLLRFDAKRFGSPVCLLSRVNQDSGDLIVYHLPNFDDLRDCTFSI